MIKSLYFFWCCLLYSFTCIATHNIGGEIIYHHVSGLTYQATIITYTKASVVSADRDTLELNWGDGTIEKVLRTNGPMSPSGIPNGEPIGNDIKLSIYESGVHLYPAHGDYNISVQDPNRTGSIININSGSSINVQLYIESLIRTKDSTYCPDQSVFFEGSPIFYTNVYDRYVHNLTTNNPDGDSLSFELIEPLQGDSFPVPNYQFPDQILPGSNNNFSINPVTGEIIWDTPQLPGIYSVAVKVNEWKKCSYAGFVEHELQIIVVDDSVPNFGFINLQNWPTDLSGNYFVSVDPGDTVDLSFSTVNADSINSFGEIYHLNNPATFTYNNSTGVGNFFWTPDSANANGREYITVFRASQTVNGITFKKDLTLMVSISGTSPCACMVDSCFTQDIIINQGWNIISTYILPDNPNFLDVINDIAADILLVQSNQGRHVVPIFGINDIGNWNILEGYMVKASANTILTIGCQQVDPSTTPINLSAGWSIIPYLRNSNMNIATALSSILGDIIIVKSPTGNVYIPLIGIDNIGDMEPGKGYRIKMNNAGTLIYPGN